MRIPVSSLAALLMMSCELAELADLSGPALPAAVDSPRLETGLYRESDGQVVVQVFNRGSIAVRDVEIDVERVSPNGRRKLLDHLSIHRRIGPGSMDQTRTSLFLGKRDLERVEARVTDADPSP